MDHITDSNHTHTLCVDLLPQRDWSTAPSCELYTCGFIVGDAADVLRVGFGPFNARNGGIRNEMSLSGGKFGHRGKEAGPETIIFCFWKESKGLRHFAYLWFLLHSFPLSQFPVQ
ncbi:hypothetical protein AAMO2058_000680300 [Amorphochlora amoebiformis]